MIQSASNSGWKATIHNGIPLAIYLRVFVNKFDSILICKHTNVAIHYSRFAYSFVDAVKSKIKI